MKVNEPTTEDILSTCFGIQGEDKLIERTEQMKEATAHLESLQKEHARLIEEVNSLEVEATSSEEDFDVEKKL